MVLFQWFAPLDELLFTGSSVDLMLFLINESSNIVLRNISQIIATGLEPDVSGDLSPASFSYSPIL